MRFYDVDSGSIKVSGKDIRDVTVASHRDRFAAVFQDFKIFGMVDVTRKIFTTMWIRNACVIPSKPSITKNTA